MNHGLLLVFSGVVAFILIAAYLGARRGGRRNVSALKPLPIPFIASLTFGSFLVLTGLGMYVLKLDLISALLLAITLAGSSGIGLWVSARHRNRGHTS